MIIDCFTFNKEFDLLEGRLEYLNDIVDYFVIVEADITFSGIQREFQYITQLQRYKKWEDKIIYLPFYVNKDGLDFNINIDNYDLTTSPWIVEYSQRNHFSKALRLFKDDDFVIIGDVDEIPSKQSIIDYIEELHISYPTIVTAQQTFIHNFNSVQDIPSYSSLFTTVKVALSTSPQGIRDKRLVTPWVRGGWHLTSFMTPAAISEKIKSFSHQEYNKEYYTNVNNIENLIKSGKDFLNRSDVTMLPFDKESLPEDFKSIFLKYEVLI